MRYVVGVFVSRLAAEGAIGALRSSGISEQRISCLTPDDAVLTAVPIADTEGSGSGRAMGAVVGGAIGFGGGFGLGVLAASALVSGIDPLSVGLWGGFVLGIGGALGGFALGGAMEEFTSDGLPKDELLVYEDAVRCGRCVVIAAAKHTAEAEAFRRLLHLNGAETVDVARNAWWIGSRSLEYPGAALDSGRDDQALHGELKLASEMAQTPSPSPGPAKRSRSA